MAAWVAKREAGELPRADEPARRDRMIDPFLPKIQEWVERSQANCAPTWVFRKLRRIGFTGLRKHCAPGGRRGQAALAQRTTRVYRSWNP